MADEPKDAEKIPPQDWTEEQYWEFTQRVRASERKKLERDAKLPWSESRILEVFEFVQEYASGPDGQWLEDDFIEALEILHGIRSR